MQRLESLGLLRPGFTPVSPGAADVELLARHGASIIACPSAQLRRGRFPLIAHLPGARMGLGTGSPAHAGGLDVLADARLAALAGGLSAGEALRMATLGSTCWGCRG
jgi:cytosine/adenosine deaminase-related metal-dependent hydrolase